MSDKKMAIFKALAESPVRIRILPPLAEPLIPGSSVHGEDADFIIAEARARHRVELVRNEPPEAALEETAKKPGKAAAAAEEGRASAVPTSGSESAEEGSPEDSQGSSSRTAKMRRRLAKLTADIARMEAQSAKNSGTK